MRHRIVAKAVEAGLGDIDGAVVGEGDVAGEIQRVGEDLDGVAAGREDLVGVGTSVATAPVPGE